MRIRIEFKLQDFWIGIFWKTERDLYESNPRTHQSTDRITTDIWICLVPCFPIHITKTKFETLTF